MSRRPIFAALILAFVTMLGGAIHVYAQADDDPMFGGRKKEDPPRGIQESLSKMRIEKDKKDFNEMVKRGGDAAKIASNLKDTSVDGQQDQIASIGKLVKKIRDELGAEGSEYDSDAMPASQPDAIKMLKDEVNGLADELKKSNRFMISASAIDRTNEILRLVKYLHG